MPSGTTDHYLNTERCIYCGQPKSIVWVHGHGQCAHCGINVDECCRGESCETVLTSRPSEDGKPATTGTVI